MADILLTPPAPTATSSGPTPIVALKLLPGAPSASAASAPSLAETGIVTVPLIGPAVAAVPAVALIIDTNMFVPPFSAAFGGPGVALGVSPKTRNGRNRATETAFLDTEISPNEFGLVRIYNSFNWVGPAAEEVAIDAAGKKMLMSLGNQGPSGNNWTHASVTAGTHDAEIDATGNALKAFGSPITIAYCHEPENNVHAPAGTPAEFAAAYQHIITRFRAIGIPNVDYALILEAFTYNPASGHYPPSQYDPGPTYIDRYMADGYNWWTRDAVWKSFATIFGSFKTWLTANHPTKAWGIGEVATEEDSGNATRKATWITDMLATLKTAGWGQLDQLCWFNSVDPAGYQWYFDTSSNSTAAFKSIANDTYFVQAVGGGAQSVATAAALAPALKIVLLPPTASATASSTSPIQVTILPNAAAAAASIPGVQLLLTVQVGTSARMGVAVPVPQIKTTLLAPIASGSGSVGIPIVKVTLLPGSGRATGSALVPTSSALVLAPVASATASVSSTPGLFINAVSARATGSAPPPSVIRSIAISAPLVAATAFAGAKLPSTVRYLGWRGQPIPPQRTTLAQSVTLVSATATFKWATSPPAPATYLAVDSIHRYNNQVFEYNSGWVVKQFPFQSNEHMTQLLDHVGNDDVTVSVVARGSQRFFSVALSEQMPVVSSIPLIAGVSHRFDLVADCSTGEWVVRWKVDLIEQPVVLSNRAEYYARAVSPSNWRQITLVPDASPERNDFEVLGFQYDAAGTYPIP